MPANPLNLRNCYHIVLALSLVGCGFRDDKRSNPGRAVPSLPPPAAPAPVPAAAPVPDLLSAEVKAERQAHDACLAAGQIYDVKTKACRTAGEDIAKTWHGITFAETDIVAYLRVEEIRENGSDGLEYEFGDTDLYRHSKGVHTYDAAFVLQAEPCKNPDEVVERYRHWSSHVSMTEPKAGNNGRLDYVVFDWKDDIRGFLMSRVYVFAKNPRTDICATMTVLNFGFSFKDEHTIFDSIIPTIGYAADAEPAAVPAPQDSH